MTVRELLASNEGTLPAYAWPGGYPLLYHAADGFTFCPACAQAVLIDDGYDAADKPTVGDIFYEGPAERCEHCGAEIESAYGDPDAGEPCESCGATMPEGRAGRCDGCAAEEDRVFDAAEEARKAERWESIVATLQEAYPSTIPAAWTRARGEVA